MQYIKKEYKINWRRLPFLVALVFSFSTVLLIPIQTQAAPYSCVCDHSKGCEVYEMHPGIQPSAATCADYCKAVYSTDEKGTLQKDGQYFVSSETSEAKDVIQTCREDQGIATAAKNESLESSSGGIGSSLVETARETLPSQRPFVTPNLDIKIPGLTFTEPTGTDVITVNFIGEYINAIYKWMIGSGITIAIVMIMIGGLQYTLGNTDSGKKKLKNSMIGFTLLLSVYLILATVNPELVFFRPLNLRSVEGFEVDTSFMESNVNPGGGAGISIPSGSGFNDVPIFKQAGAPWGQTAYGNLKACPGSAGGTADPVSGCCTKYAWSGCGPTSLAMVLKYYGENVDPSTAGDYAVKYGARSCNNGTTNIAKNITKEWNNFSTKYVNRNIALKALRNNLPLIVGTPLIPGPNGRTKPCYIAGGHYIVLTGIDNNGVIRVNDPAGGKCFKDRSPDDGFFGEPGLGLTGMTEKNFNKIPSFLLIAPQEKFIEMSL